MVENNPAENYLRENFVPWDITGQRYSPEHIFRHMLYNNAS